MIDFETYHRIHYLAEKEQFSDIKIALELGLDRGTVARWRKRKTYAPRKKTTARGSLLDPFKKDVLRLLDRHPYSAKQIYQQLQEKGFRGGYTIVREYVKTIRPQKPPAYLRLHFEPGDAAQMDWGECGLVPMEGGVQRKLYVFTLVLCHSRLLYIRFYPKVSMEHFLDGFVHGLEYFGGVPRRLIIDNLKTGVLSHKKGQEVLFNPRFLDLTRHYGSAPIACNVRKGNEKGRVERGVGYVKNNFLRGYNLTSFEQTQADGEKWLETIANQRIHGTTQKVPREHFIKEERKALLTLRMESYDTRTEHVARVSKDCRFQYEGNSYSVPPLKRSGPLKLKISVEKLEAYQNDLLVAVHKRSYGKGEDHEHPEHVKELKDTRKRAREQNLPHDFQALGKSAIEYRKKLEERGLNWRMHLRKILALVEIYGKEKVVRTLEDCLESEAFGSDYISHLLECRERLNSPPGVLHVTRGADQLEVTVPESDLEIYETLNE